LGLALLVGLASPALGASATLAVTVEDSAGNPIEGANVMAYRKNAMPAHGRMPARTPEDTKVTDANGEATLTVPIQSIHDTHKTVGALALPGVEARVRVFGLTDGGTVAVTITLYHWTIKGLAWSGPTWQVWSASGGNAKEVWAEFAMPKYKNKVDLLVPAGTFHVRAATGVHLYVAGGETTTATFSHN
jgi:hypothetical protein